MLCWHCAGQVRHGVETRVKEALSRAQQLEKQQEHTAAQHAAEVEQLKQQQADLEAALTQAKELESELRSKLTVAEAAGEMYMLMALQLSDALADKSYQRSSFAKQV